MRQRGVHDLVVGHRDALGFASAARGVLHQRAVNVGAAYADSLNLKDAAVSAVPQPFSPFHWRHLKI